MPSDSLKLTFLTEDAELRELIAAYWDVDPASQKFSFTAQEIAATYSTTPSQLHKLVASHCQAASVSRLCERCKAPYVYMNRTEFIAHRNSKYAFRCKACLSAATRAHQAQTPRRSQEAQEAQERERRDVLWRSYSLARHGPVHCEDMDLQEAIYALSLFRAGASEDFKYILPLAQLNTRRLTPSHQFDVEVVRSLWRKGVILPHPGSSLDGFVWTDEGPSQIYLDRVHWGWPSAEPSPSLRDVYNSLETRIAHGATKEEWEAARGIAMHVALLECFEYLAISLSKHNLPFEPGEKTRDTFLHVLRRFSIGQAFSFIWRSAKDAAAFRAREPVSRQHAANTVVGAVQRLAERASSEKWDVWAYRRTPECPQSMISQVVFGGLLGVGESYFERTLGSIFGRE